ncbi:MAG: MCE family protein [Acidobacteria bacterium]|nr:MAG: MCE family protein [Acidobacteriota bacterium]MCE7958004.1 MCE family protein [Acidobacteria bacterium ACB2]
MTTTAKIGAFFLVVLLLLGALILKIEDVPIGKRARTVTAEIRFQDVSGLDDKSAVRIAGVRVGKVDGIRLLPDGTALARVVLDPEVVLREGAWGQIRNMGLLGDKYVELYPGRPDGTKLPGGARIDGTIPTTFDDLTKLAGDIGKDVKQLTEALSGSLGGEQGTEKLNRIVDNIGRLAEALRELVEANRANVDVTVANLREFSAEIRATLSRIDRILDENRMGVKGSVSNIEEITDKLKTTADNLNSITTKIDTGEGTVGKLVNSEETHQNLNEALQSVKQGVDSLNTTLTRINRIELDLGFRGEYLTRKGVAKTYFTLDVVPRENKFYRVEFVAIPGGLRRDTTEYTTVTLPDGTQTVTKKEIESFEDEFGLSLQLGYRVKNTVGRAGLFESRGGVGLDQMFNNDKLRVSAEVWDFGRFNAQPHGKLYGQWQATPHIYLNGGVDDVFNSDVRSLFLGAGIRWKDEDIKSLLGSLSLLK